MGRFAASFHPVPWRQTAAARAGPCLFASFGPPIRGADFSKSSAGNTKARGAPNIDAARVSLPDVSDRVPRHLILVSRPCGEVALFDCPLAAERDPNESPSEQRSVPAAENLSNVGPTLSRP